MYRVFVLIFIISGCGFDDTNLNHNGNVENKRISLYSGSVSNFDRAYMLANAFSSNYYYTILALGLRNETFSYTMKNKSKVDLIPHENDFAKISELILNSAADDKEFDFYVSSMDVERNKLLSNEAFSLIDNIYVVLEGTASLGSSDDLIKSSINFYNTAIENGVNSVKYVIWDSIDQTSLINHGGIGDLLKYGIEFHFINLNNMKDKIVEFETASSLISAAIYSGAINESIVGSDIFIKSNSYQKDKYSLILLGSYTTDQPIVSYINQVEILKNLELMIDLENYNIIFKGHPREISVNEWIANNSDNISYFNSFPYEIWQVLGHGLYTYEYEGIDYEMYLPKAPKEIYSIFSTILYGEDKSKIKKIFGYNSLSEFNKITSTPHDVALGDIFEFNRWNELTGSGDTPFMFVFDYLNRI